MNITLHPPTRDAQGFNPLTYPLCLTEPRYLSGTSAWEEHVPFALACVEMLRPCVLVELGTHKGELLLRVLPSRRHAATRDEMLRGGHLEGR